MNYPASRPHTWLGKGDAGQKMKGGFYYYKGVLFSGNYSYKPFRRDDGTKPYVYFSEASDDAKDKILANMYSSIIKGNAKSVVTGELPENILGETSEKRTKITVDEMKRWNGETLMNNYYNLINLLIHENLHVKGNYRSVPDGFDDIFEHLRIWIDQTSHFSWKHTTQAYKDALMTSAYGGEDSFTGYINKARSVGGGLQSFVDFSANRKSPFKTKQDEISFDYYYDIYKKAVEQYNSITTGEKIKLRTKADLTGEFVPPKQSN